MLLMAARASALALGNDQSLEVGAVGEFLAHRFAPTGNNGDFLKAGAAVEHAAADVGGCLGNRADAKRGTALEAVSTDGHTGRGQRD